VEHPMPPKRSQKLLAHWHGSNSPTRSPLSTQQPLSNGLKPPQPTRQSQIPLPTRSPPRTAEQAVTERDVASVLVALCRFSSVGSYSIGVCWSITAHRPTREDSVDRRRKGRCSGPPPQEKTQWDRRRKKRCSRPLLQPLDSRPACPGHLLHSHPADTSLSNPDTDKPIFRP